MTKNDREKIYQLDLKLEKLLELIKHKDNRNILKEIEDFKSIK